MSDGPSRQHYSLTLAALAVSALAYALMQTMVAPALPQIQRDLNTSTTSVTWVLTVYLLAASVATPVLGRLGDIFGKERILVWVLALFGAGSVLAALSHSLPLLIAGRAIQGAGGAVFPLAFGIIRDEFPQRLVGTGIGLISATFGIGGGAGLVLSGLIVDHLEYEWIFWLGLGGTVIAVAATILFVPESPVKTPARIDWAGAALLSAGLICVLLGVSEGNTWGWTSAGVLGLFVAGIAILAIWMAFETKVAQPLVSMNLMRLRGVWTTNLAGLLVGFGMFGSFILIPQFVQAPTPTGYGFGASVTEAGLFLLPSAAVMLFAGPLAGSLGVRYGSKVPLTIGALVGCAAFILLSLFHSTHASIFIAGGVLGLGIGFAFASMANLIVEAVPQTHTGEATGINTIMRTIGGALGAQVAASIVSGQVSPSTGLPEEVGYTDAFVMSAVAMFVAFLAALLVPGRRPQAESSSADQHGSAEGRSAEPAPRK